MTSRGIGRLPGCSLIKEWTISVSENCDRPFEKAPLDNTICYLEDIVIGGCTQRNIWLYCGKFWSGWQDFIEAIKVSLYRTKGDLGHSE